MDNNTDKSQLTNSIGSSKIRDSLSNLSENGGQSSEKASKLISEFRLE